MLQHETVRIFLRRALGVERPAVSPSLDPVPPDTPAPCVVLSANLSLQRDVAFLVVPFSFPPLCFAADRETRRSLSPCRPLGHIIVVGARRCQVDVARGHLAH